MVDTLQPRRRFLVQSAAMVAGGTLAVPSLHAQQVPESSELPQIEEYIDAHVHVWTDDLQRYPLSDEFSRDQMQPRTFTPVELQNHCRPCGVKRVVLIQMSYYGFDNRYMLDVIAKHPGVYAGVAVIDADAANVAEEMRSLRDKKVSGFRLHTVSHRGKALEAWMMRPGIQTMWKTCADTGQAICMLMNPDALPIVDALCERFPKTRVVIDHMARIGVDGMIRPDDVESLKRCARHENTFVKVSAFYALGKKTAPYVDLAPLIRELVTVYGSHRLMWASDCPFQVQDGHRYADSVDLIRQRLDFLTDEDRAWMLSKTAAQVYFNSVG